MHVAFGRVRRKTEPTGPGSKAVIFSKLTLMMVRLGNHTIGVNLAIFDNISSQIRVEVSAPTELGFVKQRFLKRD